MVPAKIEIAGALDTYSSTCEVSKLISLADVASGNVPLVPVARQNIDASPIVSLYEIGAVPVPASELRERERNRAHAHLLANVTLSDKILADTEGPRLQYAYRMVVTLARITGLLNGTGLLASAINPQENGLDPFYYPTRLKINGMTQGVAKALKSFQALNELENVTTVSAPSGIEQVTGLTFLPPPIPDKFYQNTSNKYDLVNRRVTNQIPTGYDPARDEALCLWLDGMEAIAYHLGLDRGSKNHPEKGIYGLTGMLSARTARLVWPCKDDLLNFEQELMFFIGDLLNRRKSFGNSYAEQTPETVLIEEMGMTRAEAVMICKAAGIFMSYVYSDDAEALRAKEIQRLEAIADRCLDSNDPRAEMAVLKHKHQLMGLTKNAEAEGMQDFRNLAAKALEDAEEDYYLGE